MPSESVKVMVRVRPLNDRELTKSSKSTLEVDTQISQIVLQNSSDAELQKVFAYDAVFPTTITQQAVYEEAAFQLVESVLEGYNGTIFAYGQTGCGKTHTMMGNPAVEPLRGIIPRAFEHIFGKIDSSAQKNYLIRCSYIEIYNEEIHDLIGKDWKIKLELKENQDKGVFIKDVAMHVVKSAKEIEQLMEQGTRNRSVGETAMNKDSSRSHSIFTMYIEASELDEKGKQRITAGKLNLVDLAGSERQSKTQATGDRLKEANKINLSLSALGNVISALVDGKSSHIPYRDSKLTRLLQDSLGGNTKTVMIANVSPAADSYDETLGTLRYASRAKNIKNQPKVNEDPKDTLLREYAEEIKRLKEMLTGGPGPGAGGGAEVISAPISNTRVKENRSPSIRETRSPSFRETRSPSIKETDKTPKINSSKLSEYESELKQKDQLINDEKLKRERLEEKLREMQEALVQAGKQEGEEKKKYEEMASKLKNKEITKIDDPHEQQKKEDEVLLTDNKYNSLQEEVEEQRKLIKRLRKKYRSAVQEIKDLEKEHELSRGDLLDTIRLLERDVKINNAIVANLLSPEELDNVKARAKWRDDRNEFYIPPFLLQNKRAKFPKLPHHQAATLMKDEWENRDLEFEIENPDESRDNGDDNEKDQEEKSFQRLPTNNNKRDCRVKPGGQATIEPNGRTNRHAVQADSNVNARTINYGSLPPSRNIGKLNDSPIKNISPSPDPFERGASIQDRTLPPENISKQVFQKNTKNVHLDPLIGGSPQSISPNKKDIQIIKPNVDNLSMLGRGPLKPLAPLKENFGSNPRAIQVNFKATLLVGGGDNAGNEGDISMNGDLDLPVPKGKVKLQALDRGGV